MRRVSLALALVSAAVFGCAGGKKPGSETGNGSAKGEQGVYYYVNIFSPPIGGHITSDVGGIDCGASAVTVNNAVTPPQYQYTLGTHAACGTAGQTRFAWTDTVVLTATADAGKSFYGWAGDCVGVDTCTLTAGADKTVVAVFGPPGGGHTNFLDPELHGSAFRSGTLACAGCHGSQLQGQGIAPACNTCHSSVGGAAQPESCNSCHRSGIVGVAAVHAITGKIIATAGPVTLTAGTPATVSFTVNVKVDGVDSDAFTGTLGQQVRRLAYNAARVAPTVIAPYERFSLVGAAANDGFTITPVGGGTGNYNVTITDGTVATAAAGIAQKYLVTLALPTLWPGSTTVPANVGTAIANLGGTDTRDLVGNQACLNCHGSQVFRHREASGEWHHGANPYGAEACVVCHTRYGSVSRSMGGDRMTAYVHGVHNSHEMPPRDITQLLNHDGDAATPTIPFTVTKPDGVYARNDSLRMVAGSTTAAEISSPWSVGFPGYMVNCSSCHDSQARLDAIMAKPISLSTCLSCHDSWNGFPTFDTASAKYTARVAADANWPTVLALHQAIVMPAAGTATANGCVTCHDGIATYTPATGPVRPIFSTVGEVHNLRFTVRNGLVYDGRDQSIAEGARIAMTVTGVTVLAGPPAQYRITWTATRDGSAVNPCNTAVSTTAPIFHAGGAANAATGQAASNMSILIAYAQGDDWVNGVGTSPGQPAAATNLTTANTTCASDVATTTVNVPAGIPAFVTRGAIGLQGKPQITFSGTNVNPGQTNPDQRVIQLRSESPTYAFEITSGAAAAPRRAVVSNEKCLACHAGSLYQHGGNRIDSVELCVMCHNPAASEKNVRVGMGVDATEAYDGKVGQTYDLRYMLHAIHSAGETNALLVYYRTNGVYAFGSRAAIDAIPNWPGPGSFRPFGAGANEPARTHNEIVIHYPRALNECGACHVDGSVDDLGDQTVRMAVTVHDSGATQAFNEAAPVYTGAPNANLVDDVLMGAGAASCFSCHQSGVPATQAALRGHGSGYGFPPAAMPNGRQDLIDCSSGILSVCP